MTIRKSLILLACSSVLAACSGGVQAPKEVAGEWGADCSHPFVQFEGSNIKVFPDNATYKLKAAAIANNQLTVTYDTKQGAVTEVYVVEGSTLRLDHGNYGGTDATWHKAPMNKCG